MPRTGWFIQRRKFGGMWMLSHRDYRDLAEQRLSPLTFYSHERAEAVLDALQKTAWEEEAAFQQQRLSQQRRNILQRTLVTRSKSLSTEGGS